jgi:hypothetical protein
MNIKPNKNNLYVFDFWCFIGYTIYLIFALAMVNHTDIFLNIFHSIIFKVFICYNILKSIFGIIFLINSLIKKEITITKNVLFFIFDFIFIIFLILLFKATLEQTYKFSDPDFNYNNIINYKNITIPGLSINAFQIYIFAIVNLFINILGIPMWHIYFCFKTKTRNIMKISFNILTRIIIIINNMSIMVFMID